MFKNLLNHLARKLNPVTCMEADRVELSLFSLDSRGYCRARMVGVGQILTADRNICFKLFYPKTIWPETCTFCQYILR